MFCKRLYLKKFALEHFLSLRASDWILIREKIVLRGQYSWDSFVIGRFQKRRTFNYIFCYSRSIFRGVFPKPHGYHEKNPRSYAEYICIIWHFFQRITQTTKSFFHGDIEIDSLSPLILRIKLFVPVLGVDSLHPEIFERIHTSPNMFFVRLIDNLRDILFLPGWIFFLRDFRTISKNFKLSLTNFALNLSLLVSIASSRFKKTLFRTWYLF